MFNTGISTLPCMGIFTVWGFRNPILTSVSTVKNFQRCKIQKYLQNIACMSFNLFTRYIYMFFFTEEMTFLDIKYPLLIWASLFVCWPSWSAIIVYPNIVMCDTWPDDVIFFFVFFLIKKKSVWNCSFVFYKFLNKDSTMINDLLFHLFIKLFYINNNLNPHPVEFYQTS